MISYHSEHCRRCKETMGRLLTAIYGECMIGHSFPWPTKPEDYEKTAIGEALRRIFAALQASRGHRDFIRCGTVPPCDFYVPGAGFILEFDESQHFTRLRHVALSLYREGFQVGFGVAQWLELCRLIDAKDPEPPDRDERRAWYDTLRDFVPPLHGFKPTARVHSQEFAWCSLDAGSKKGRGTFCSLLKERLPATGK